MSCATRHRDRSDFCLIRHVDCVLVNIWSVQLPVDAVVSRSYKQIQRSEFLAALMFQFLTILLTTTAVSLHALLGCCAHHAHSHAVEEVCQDVQVIHHDHDEATHTIPCQNENHSDGLPCDESECQFISNSTSIDLKSAIVVSTFANEVADSTHGSLLLVAFANVERDRSVESCRPSLRALKCVWQV